MFLDLLGLLGGTQLQLISRGSAAADSNTTTLVFNPTGNFSAGSFAIIGVACNNSNTNGVPMASFTVTDSLGNTWSKKQALDYDPGAANAGFDAGIWLCEQDVGLLQTSTTITVTVSTTTGKMAAILDEVVPTSLYQLSFDKTGAAAGSNGTTHSVVTDALSSPGVLLCYAPIEYGLTGEFNPLGVTFDVDTLNGSWATGLLKNAPTGSGAAGMSIARQGKITSGADAQTWNLTFDNSADSRLGWVSITETIIDAGEEAESIANLPEFERVGTMFQAPAWMTETEGPLSPRLFENDLYRHLLPNLPPTRFSLLFSTDHASVTGRIGRVDFDDIENPGDWVDSGAAIHVSATRETPHPVYDAENNRVNVYVHDGQSDTLYGSQASRLLTSSDLSTLTDQGQCTGAGHHTGYGQGWYENGRWRLLTTLYGGKISDLALWESKDPADFGSSYEFIPSAQMEIIGEGKTLKGRFVFDYEGQRYMIGALTTHPSDTNNATAYIAFPVNRESLLPVGTQRQTLLTPGSGDDAVLHNSMGVYEIDEVLYLIYIGRNAGETSNSIMLAKSVANTTAFRAGFNRKKVRPPAPETLFHWDAANDPIPAGITTVVPNGSNESTQSVGNWYRATTGSGSLQSLILQGTSAYDPRDYDAIGFKLTGVRSDPTVDQTKIWWMFGWRDDPDTPTNAANFYWQNGTWDDGRFQQSNTGTVASSTAFAMPFMFSTVSEWIRNEKFEMEMLLLDAGTIAALMVNGRCVFLRTLDAPQLAALKPFIRVNVPTSPFPAWYVEFESWSVQTYRHVAATGRRKKLSRVLATQFYKG